MLNFVWWPETSKGDKYGKKAPGSEQILKVLYKELKHVIWLKATQQYEYVWKETLQSNIVLEVCKHFGQ